MNDNNATTRRTFLKGMALATAAASAPMGLMGCNSSGSDSKSLNIFPEQLKNNIKSYLDEITRESTGYNELVRSCLTFGTRMLNTPAIRDAEDDVLRLLSDYGLSGVEKQSFLCDVWNRVHCRVSIVNQDNQDETLDVIAFGRSPDTTVGSGKLVAMGNGNPEDYENNPGVANGNFVLVPIREILGEGEDADIGGDGSKTQKLETAIKYGAAGVIIISGRDEKNASSVGLGPDGEPRPIPALVIGKSNGLNLHQRLLKYCKDNPDAIGFDINFDIQNTNGPVREYNVFAELPGSDLADEIIVLGGHFDTWDLSVGAIDNGVGCYTILDIARAMVQGGYQPRRTIHFVLFGAEEQELCGSKAYLTSMFAQGRAESIKYFMNIDMRANPSGFETFGVPEATIVSDEVGEVIRTKIPEYKNVNSHDDWRFGSDHKNFMLFNVPSISPYNDMDIGWDEVMQRYHTEADGLDGVSEMDMLRNAQIVGAMMVYLADIESLPKDRFTEEELPELFIKYGMDKSLKKNGEWRWG